MRMGDEIPKNLHLGAPYYSLAKSNRSPFVDNFRAFSCLSLYFCCYTHTPLKSLSARHWINPLLTVFMSSFVCLPTVLALDYDLFGVS